MARLSLNPMRPDMLLMRRLRMPLKLGARAVPARRRRRVPTRSHRPRTYAKRVATVFTSDAISGDAKVFFDEGTAVIAAAGTLNRAVLDPLVTELGARAAAAWRSLPVQMTLATVGGRASRGSA
ncbi:MAG: hypothetical protein ACK51M_10860, partial [Burkholderiales bacterium]